MRKRGTHSSRDLAGDADGSGRPELLAPSVTRLPAGYAERVQLRACGEAGDGRPAIELPQVLIDVLAERTGAIYVRG